MKWNININFIISDYNRSANKYASSMTETQAFNYQSMGFEAMCLLARKLYRPQAFAVTTSRYRVILTSHYH